ncbi:MAG: helix-turn-helix transcriptional regulator [Verrucomicrobiales bacterium]|nr:helix-turn-helix transcriptional regulator [Verrucomicrobiales bacterium]
MTNLLQGSSSELHPVIWDSLFDDINTPHEASFTMDSATADRLFKEFRRTDEKGPDASGHYESRVREVITRFFYSSPASSNPIGGKMVNRIENAKSIIKRDLGKPFNLRSIAEEVGCSSAYLSRNFSQQESRTIRQFLRETRIAKAKELLERGDLNTSETCLEIGYRSLSHFSKAFQEEVGMLPLEYRSKHGKGTK